jgi:hypothetical protein
MSDKDSVSDYVRMAAVAIPSAHVGKKIAEKITSSLGVPSHSSRLMQQRSVATKNNEQDGRSF